MELKPPPAVIAATQMSQRDGEAPASLEHAALACSASDAVSGMPS